MIKQDIYIQAFEDEAVRHCMVYADEKPEIILIQLVERKEVDLFENEVSLIRNSAQRPFAMLGFPIIDWCKELMPWNDEAVDRREESGRWAGKILQVIEQKVIPSLYERYGVLPCILGGYSLGGLFSLWAATRSQSFAGIAAASPSVWISNWMNYVSEHPLKAKAIYMSLGDKEEHVKNRFIKQVGDNIRSYHSLILKQFGDENTVLEWSPGGHFQDFEVRTARAFSWVISKL